MKLTIGCDEVGIGAISGPVVAAGVVMPADLTIPGLKDSKKIGLEGERSRLSAIVRREALFWSIAGSSVENIDRVGIQRCRMACLRTCALLGLGLYPDAEVIVDGNSIIPGVDWRKQKAIVKADDKVQAVSAASVLAKVHRDQIMVDLWYEFPHYGWKRNCGYPTAEHKAALSKFGVSPHHRKSYRPVAEILERHGTMETVEAR